MDANCAWSGRDIAALSRELAELGVEFIEQPLPPDAHEKMPEILQDSALPIFADESCVTRDDVGKIPAQFSGFNIKLVKCGGLTPALAMLRARPRTRPAHDGRLHAGKQRAHRRGRGHRAGD